MSAHPLVTFVQLRQRPGAGPVLPPRKPGREPRKRLSSRLRVRHRAAPVVLTPADLRP